MNLVLATAVLDSLATLGIPTIVAAVVTGTFLWLRQRTENSSPDTVAGGYTQLVSDLRLEQGSLRQRVENLERRLVEGSERIEKLTRQVDWLLYRLPPQYIQDYQQVFNEQVVTVRDIDDTVADQGATRIRKNDLG